MNNDAMEDDTYTHKRNINIQNNDVQPMKRPQGQIFEEQELESMDDTKQEDQMIDYNTTRRIPINIENYKPTITVTSHTYQYYTQALPLAKKIYHNYSDIMTQISNKLGLNGTFMYTNWNSLFTSNYNNESILKDLIQSLNSSFSYKATLERIFNEYISVLIQKKKANFEEVQSFDMDQVCPEHKLGYQDYQSLAIENKPKIDFKTRYHEQIQSLAVAGFTNIDQMIDVLRNCQGDVEEAMLILSGIKKPEFK